MNEESASFKEVYRMNERQLLTMTESVCVVAEQTLGMFEYGLIPMTQFALLPTSYGQLNELIPEEASMLGTTNSMRMTLPSTVVTVMHRFMMLCKIFRHRNGEEQRSCACFRTILSPHSIPADLSVCSWTEIRTLIYLR
jgi:hypothetical protein